MDYDSFCAAQFAALYFFLNLGIGGLIVVRDIYVATRRVTKLHFSFFCKANELFSSIGITIHSVNLDKMGRYFPNEIFCQI